MSQQTIKQRARRQALDVAARHRRERAEREKRLRTLTTACLTAILERDEFVAIADRRAGDALREMTEAEGLTLREAAEWCGISVREATRIRHMSEDDGASLHTEPVTGETAENDVSSQDGGAGASTAAG